MQTTIKGIRVTGIAAAVPKTELDLASLGGLYGETDVQRIVHGTGIAKVRVAAPETKASDLCAAAAEALLTALQIEASSIDAVVFVSQTPDRVMPATSALLQHRLGLKTTAAAFDISYGCSGYIYGLLQASMLLSSGGCRRVLVCAGDVITPFLHAEDRHVRMLFGDGGSATLVERGDGEASFAVHTDGSGANDLTVTHGRDAALADQLGVRSGHLHMEGASVLTFALREVPAVLDEVLGLAGWAWNDIGLCALHQANRFILHYIRRKLPLPPNTVPEALSDTGNTGPASIPLLLARVGRDYEPKARLKTLLCGFGVGLSWGAAALDLSSTRMLPMLEV